MPVEADFGAENCPGRGEFPEFGQLGQISTELGRCGPCLAESRPILVKFRLKLAIGHFRPKFDRIWPKFGNKSQIRPSVVEIGPNYYMANFGRNLGARGTFSATCGQLFGNCWTTS